MASRHNFNGRPKLLFTLASVIIGLSVLFGISGVSCSAPTPSQTPAATPTIPKPEQVWSADGIIKIGEYSGNMQYGDYEIFWWSDNQYVYIGMRAKTTGFVAVGLQPGSRMKNADMIFGFVKDEKVTVLDLFSSGDFGPHPPDTQLGGTDDIVEFGGSEEGGFTTIEFKRALNTSDEYDLALYKGVNKIIWAYGANDELTLKHSSRGYGEISL